MEKWIVDILIAIIGIIAASTIFIIIKKKTDKSKTKTTQKGNIVFGDQVGRDIIKKGNEK